MQVIMEYSKSLFKWFACLDFLFYMFEETRALRIGRYKGEHNYSSDYKYRSTTVSAGAIWGYVVGTIVIVVICMICCCYWRRKRSLYEHMEQTKRLTAAIPRKMTLTDRRKEPIVMFSCRHSNQQRHLDFLPPQPIEDSGFHE